MIWFIPMLRCPDKKDKLYHFGVQGPYRGAADQQVGHFPFPLLHAKGGQPGIKLF